MAHQDQYVALFPLLADHWKKPFSKLPKALRARVSTWIIGWGYLTPEQRQYHVREIDYKNDPALAGERLIEGYNHTMDARTWWKMQNVTPKDAAMVLSRLNPNSPAVCEDPESIYVDGDKTSPHRYRLLLKVFESVASTAPKPRMLLEWRAIAQQHGLCYHAWIDDYTDAMGVPAEKQAAPDAIDNTTNKVTEQPPGKIPNTEIGKLAIKAAWQIECELGRKASMNEVMKRLQAWVGKEEALIEIIPHGVKWMTSGLHEKNYEKSACSKTLETWNKSRA